MTLHVYPNKHPKPSASFNYLEDGSKWSSRDCTIRAHKKGSSSYSTFFSNPHMVEKGKNYFFTTRKAPAFQINTFEGFPHVFLLFLAVHAKKIKVESYIIFIISFHSKMNNIICLFWDHLAIKLLYSLLSSLIFSSSSFFASSRHDEAAKNLLLIIKHDLTFPTLYTALWHECKFVWMCASKGYFNLLWPFKEWVIECKEIFTRLNEENLQSINY